MNGMWKVTNSKWIDIVKEFLQDASYAPVGFCLTEVPITILLEETSGYKMGQSGQRNVKRMHSLFVDKRLPRKTSQARDRKLNYCKSKHGHRSMLL